MNAIRCSFRGRIVTFTSMCWLGQLCYPSQLHRDIGRYASTRSHSKFIYIHALDTYILEPAAKVCHEIVTYVRWRRLGSLLHAPSQIRRLMTGCRCREIAFGGNRHGVRLLTVTFNNELYYLHLFPTNYGQSACNSVNVQPISTLRLPNHARMAAELSNRRHCLHYFRNACTVAKIVRKKVYDIQ